MFVLRLPVLEDKIERAIFVSQAEKIHLDFRFHMELQHWLLF